MLVLTRVQVIRSTPRVTDSRIQRLLGRLLKSESCYTSSLRFTHPTVYFSGIQPTGVPHLGNYFGLIEPWLKVQKSEPSSTAMYLSIVDLHAISTGFLPRERMAANIVSMAAGLLACGVDPERTVLFQQSAVLEHSTLMFVLGALQTLPRLRRLPQFKDKAKRYKEGEVPVNLLTYPVLQAADVLLYKGTHVPVGDDQSQHMNLLADLAARFNSFWRLEYFPIPLQVAGTHRRIKSLRNPQSKMSKSDADGKSRIDICDSREQIFNKCAKALSDFESNVTYEPERRPAISNLINLYCAVSDLEPAEVVRLASDLDTRGFKEKLAEALDERFSAVRERYEDLTGRNQARVKEVLRFGAEEAGKIASNTMQEIWSIIGFRP